MALNARQGELFMRAFLKKGKLGIKKGVRLLYIFLTESCF